MHQIITSVCCWLFFRHFFVHLARCARSTVKFLTEAFLLDWKTLLSIVDQSRRKIIFGSPTDDDGCFGFFSTWGFVSDCLLRQQSVKAFHESRCSNQMISWRRLRYFFPINHSIDSAESKPRNFYFIKVSSSSYLSWLQDDDDYKWSIKGTEATSKDITESPAVDIPINSPFLSS